MESRFWNKVNIKSDTECWEWTGYCRNGYGRVCYTVSKNIKKYISAHRIAYELHHKRPIQEGMYILHSCDNPKCCNPHHLREGTHQDNMDDMKSKGRHNGNKKLSIEQVIQIREKYYKDNYSYSSLAREYNVYPACISDIINKKSWSNV